MENKNIFYSVLLFCLFLCKIGSFHVYTHQDPADISLENCDLCQTVSKSDGDDFLLGESFTEDHLTRVVEAKIEFGILAGKKSKDNSTKLLCRPPPTFFS